MQSNRAMWGHLPLAGRGAAAVTEQPRVGVIMGSDSDWSVMQDAAEALAEFDVPAEVRVVSAHRTPAVMFDYARGAADRGIEVIIAGAGGAAHLPGMVAAATPLPVIGVPVPLARLDGLDSLLSIVQMPAGVPVATVSIAGAAMPAYWPSAFSDRPTRGCGRGSSRSRTSWPRPCEPRTWHCSESIRVKLPTSSNRTRRPPPWLDGPETRHSMCSSCLRNTMNCGLRYVRWRKKRSRHTPLMLTRTPASRRKPWTH